MKRNVLFSRGAATGLLAAVLTAALVAGAAAEPVDGARRANRRGGFDLLRAGSVWVARANKVECGLFNGGEVCTDIFNSPTGGGGNWPGGSPNQYIFNSGLQIAGIIPYNSAFTEWAGDTLGAYFFDARGTQRQGQAVDLIYSSVTPSDLAQWPNLAVVRDASIYDPALIGRNAVSQEDTWTQYYDGPTLLSGRKHGMGILVTQRSLAWNFPAGNEDILYFLYTFTNITASDRSAYNSLDPAIQDDIHAIGQRWVAAAEAQSGVDIPSGGYRIDSLFAAFAMDPDVGSNFQANASTAILPFNMGLAYNTAFDEPTWFYDPAIFRPPFGPFPGFVGVKYLRSPIDPATQQEVGLTLFSNTNNPNQSGTFPDPVGASQLWRYLSGRITPSEGDNPCDVNPPIQRRLCAVFQFATDTRFYQSSGPTSLGPGESATIVVAYVHAAPIDQYVRPFFKGFLAAGTPSTGAAIFAGDTIRTIERATGWASHTDLNGDQAIQQDEVTTVPSSLLWKGLVAQTLFDVKFLLPFGPEAPEFFLLPGNNQVTVVWQKSVTDGTTPDPYYNVAADPQSALYDPNYRVFDVEGYRIYRGRTAAQLALIAQFDYAGTTFKDYTGNWAYEGNCAPELGILDDCPSDPATGNVFPLDPAVDNGIAHDLVGEINQVKFGGRVELADGSVLITESFNPVEDLGFPALSNTGVPFAFVDRSVVNSLTYYYAVSAFDVNSVVSGPASIESGLLAQSVTPRASSGQVIPGVVQSLQLIGGDGTVLDPNAALPTLDPATGIFSGPMPPTDGFDFALAAFLPDVLVDGVADVRIDSVTPGDAFAGSFGDIKYYMTATGTAGSFQFAIPGFHHTSSSGVTSSSGTTPVVGLDAGKAGLFGGDATYQLSATAQVSVEGVYRLGSWGRGDINGDPGGGTTVHAGPRWFVGSNEAQDEPNGGFASPSSSFAGTDGDWTDLSHTAGELPGVDLLWRPASYSTVNFEFRNVESITSSVYRAADFEVVWGPNGTIASVTDLTHRVPVEFNAGIRASWGFLTGASFAGVTEADTDDENNGLLTWADVACVTEVARSPNRTMCGSTSTPAVLVNTATLSPISDGTSSFADANALTADGDGFIFYLNGHFFLMRMTALPADGTVWNARFFAGWIRGTPGGDDYEFGSVTRPPAVPGLTARLTYTGTSFDADVTSDSILARVHTLPDPYYATSAMEITPSQKLLKFVNLPAKAIIRIYSLSGVLVAILEHNDPTGAGEEPWDIRNRNNQFVASGVYFYHIETPDGRERVGRFTVINSGTLVVQQ